MPLINDFDPEFSYFVDAHGVTSPNWAGADHTDVVGCACELLGTCPVNTTCRCDALEEEPVVEGG